MLTRVALWLEQRLHLVKLFEATAGHKVPPSTNSWFYVLGSGTLVCFALQILTGICLALVYVPSAEHAWTSLDYLNREQFLGWFLRAVHNWGSNFMVALMILHLVQTFLFGAFKFPRELTWMSGLVLMLCTLGMAFTGQVLRFDQDAYWGLGIGASIMGRVPVLGGWLVDVMLGGPIIAGETLSRFFSLHVFVIPGLIVAILSMHLRLVLNKGVSEYPAPGHPVSKATYEREYEEHVHRDGVPFAPHVIGKDLFFSAALIALIVLCAVWFGPAGPAGRPNPTLIETAPRPDFFFLWIYASLALLPAYLETVILFVAPVVVLGFLFALPFFSGTGERSYRGRPVAVLAVVTVFLTLGTLNYLGTFAPWSPRMDAWSAATLPPSYLDGRSPLELKGALLIQSKQCRNCHSLAGAGGKRGPALDEVGARLTANQLIRQVIQGSGNMPAYGKNLKPAEVTAMVAFMKTLRPSYSAERAAASMDGAGK